MTWCEETGVVAEDGAAKGFVEGNPVLTLGNCLEYYTGIMLEIQWEFFSVEEASISLFNPIWDVPMQ
ncbi:hypothetical protein RRF57_007781 [Xylaria bambusicola]|uniref:Uncharacterized protein n=1 Tax=Xylaria bambusicola TaxID=326684 RepID=A0AAN7UNA8_9PEZI